MKYTKHLLSRFITIDTDLENISKQLTHKSCEVEEVIQRTLSPMIVIGKVTGIEKHPDADKLTVCQVDCGRSGIFQICTGASNICADIYVPVALPGSYLSAIHLSIEPRMMRGLESNGMICSKEEVGIAEDVGAHGIWILQRTTGTPTGSRQIDGDFVDIDDRLLGTPLREYAPWLETRILDVENKTITHRPDMFGHRGVAREFQAIFPENVRFNRLRLIQEQLTPHTLLHTISQATISSRQVRVESPYVGAYATMDISDIQIKESSFHQRLQLIDLDIGTKNNWVDFSNYFMYLTGQPIHCFDAAKIDGAIIVRQAKVNEEFVDLLGEKHLLDEKDIVIADEKKVLALAGIIGGKDSAIDQNTKNIVIEIAQFDPVVIRKTAMRLGIRTDAQTRYEKNISPLATIGSILLCMDELQYLGPAELGKRQNTGISVWIHPDIEGAIVRSIPFSPERINTLIGISLEPTQMRDILSNLGCTFSSQGDTIYIPIRRGVDDLHHLADISEEIARIYGFDEIQPKTYTPELQAIHFSDRLSMVRSLEQLLTHDLGYNQSETYPWLHKRRHDLFGASADNNLHMQNSIAPEYVLMRHTMIPSLMEVVEKNHPFFETICVYDIGNTRTKQPTLQEHTMITMIVCMDERKNRQEDPFLKLKSDLHTLLDTHIDRTHINRAHSAYARGHTNQQADCFIDATHVGTIARLHPRCLEMIGLDDEKIVVVAELSVDILLAHKQPKQHHTYATIQDQHIWREVNFVIESNTPYGTISDAISLLPDIARLELTDLYTGKPLEPTQKSISFRFLIKGDGTMSTEQIQTIMQQVIQAGQQAGGILRQ